MATEHICTRVIATTSKARLILGPRDPCAASLKQPDLHVLSVVSDHIHVLSCGDVLITDLQWLFEAF